MTGEEALPVVDDLLWAEVQKLLPDQVLRSAGRPPTADRLVLNGILWVLTADVAWNSLPVRLGYGSGSACWQRLRAWRAAGVWPQILDVILARWRAGGRNELAAVLERNWRNREALNNLVATSRNMRFGGSIQLVIGFTGGLSESVARMLSDPIGDLLRTRVDVVAMSERSAGGVQGLSDPGTLPLVLGGAWSSRTAGALAGSPVNVAGNPLGPTLAIPLAIVVPARSAYAGWHALREASRQPGRPLVCSTPPVGTKAHNWFERLQDAARWYPQLNVCPGGGAQTQALLTGASDAAVMSMVTAGPLLKQGLVKAIAFSTTSRLPAFPDVPSIAEFGYPGLEEQTWLGLFHPDNLEARVIERIARETATAFHAPAARDFMAEVGATLRIARLA
ncbi:tripartite-type tricarboxylate transporter receptor subunit TctC/transposase [Paraburkholderia sp. JPY465]|uniref:tripartite tricarboxylate transporter substrate-binding protein n=1 Tax=Paraburkholderia sp. JPY465 TaxID=3042285 RepID=UPI003D1F6F8F